MSDRQEILLERIPRGIWFTPIEVYNLYGRDLYTRSVAIRRNLQQFAKFGLIEEKVTYTEDNRKRYHYRKG